MSKLKSLKKTANPVLCNIQLRFTQSHHPDPLCFPILTLIVQDAKMCLIRELTRFLALTATYGFI